MRPQQPIRSGREVFYTLFVPVESDLMKVRAAQSPPETFPRHSRASPAIINRCSPTVYRLLLLAFARSRLLLDELFLRGGHLFLFRLPRFFVSRIRGWLGSQKLLQLFSNARRAFLGRSLRRLLGGSLSDAASCDIRFANNANCGSSVQTSSEGAEPAISPKCSAL